MSPRRIAHALLVLAVVSIAGCPPMTEAMRDGGTTCTTLAECNPSGLTCGEVRQCVAGYCSDTTTIVACRDGGYPDAGMTGNCATYEDCNPAPACGVVVACINFVCDPNTHLEIPCPEGGDAATDASSVEGGSSEAGVVDAGD